MRNPIFPSPAGTHNTASDFSHSSHRAAENDNHSTHSSSPSPEGTLHFPSPEGTHNTASDFSHSSHRAAEHDHHSSHHAAEHDHHSTHHFCLLLILLLLLAFPLAAQESPTDDMSDAFEEILAQADRARLPSGLGDDELAHEAWLAAQDPDRSVQARELTESILRGDKDSIAGHCLMGLVQHRSEGNLPVALYHFKKCRRLFERRFGEYPGDDAPWFWHALSITEMAFISGEMGRHEDKIRLLLERDAFYEPKLPAERGWPLMRLRRYGEAREAVEEALLMGDESQVSSALTALCAIEAEQQRRQASYAACLEAANHDRDNHYGNPTPFTNAAESALGLLRFDEAEKLLLEASGYFDRDTVSNPWLDLTQLYLAEGRSGEALDAVRRMYSWRNQQPVFMEEQNRAETQMTAAIFLLIAGRPVEASRITRRAVERPDRTGFTSSDSEQLRAAVALSDVLAQRTAAEWAAEEVSWTPWRAALGKRLEVIRRRLAAWTSGRRAAAQINERILLATLRPYMAGSVEAAEWIEPELVALVGPGVTLAAVAKARRKEDLESAEGYFKAFEAEAIHLQGRHAKALEILDEALQELPGSEVLLRARLTVIGAQASLETGDWQRAVAYFDQAMQLDPGSVRRGGAALPTVVYAAPGQIAQRSQDLLDDSPRFKDAKGGFQVRLDGDKESGGAVLLSPEGTVLTTVSVRPRSGDTVDSMARRLVQELHEAAFAPRLDLTQADLRTLDGSPTAGGGRSSERLRSVFSEVEARENARP